MSVRTAGLRIFLDKSPIRFKPTQLRFAAAKGRDALMDTLDHHLKTLKENPNSIFYQSLDLWTMGVRKVTLPMWLRPLWLLGISVCILGLIIVGNIFLRRQVMLRTETLKTTIAEKEKFESELAVAREIQLQLVPGNFPAVPGRKESVTSKQKMDGVYIVSPSGRLDTGTYPVLEEHVDVVLRENPHTLVFDMQRLDYISSMGVRVIAKAQRAMKAYNGKVILLNLQPQIQKVFDIIKALPSQQVFSSMGELDDYLDRIATTGHGIASRSGVP